VTQIFAHSPEAKGRVERANGTFQDRLVSELRLAGASTLAEANEVLAEFLPRFNARFGVPAALPGSAYRTPGQEQDIDGVLCFKEKRKVARDNTIQYHGRTLQLFPGVDRTSYARARVEVQERLDGKVLVSYRGTILTPQEAPPLAAVLRAQADVPRHVEEDDFEAPVQLPEREPGSLTPDSDEGSPRVIWYEDSELRRRHRELVKAGMERARKAGKRIGRPSVRERDGFAERFEEVSARIGPGGLSLRQAARELDIGFATLKRLLDAGMPSVASSKATDKPDFVDLNGADSDREVLSLQQNGHDNKPVDKVGSPASGVHLVHRPRPVFRSPP
jgi:hypothetical protein